MKLMKPERQRPPVRPPLVLRTHAEDDLRWIRDTMARAAGTTAFPGWGAAVVGMTAVVAAAWAADAPGPTAWLARWLVECVLAMAIGAGAMALKCRSGGFAPGALRRFALVFAPPIAAGALLTWRLQDSAPGILPGAWLLLYGVGIACAGAVSVNAVRTMGIAFMVFGAAALFAPAGHGNLWLAAGFGGLHLGFGAWIARRHGG